MSDIYVPLFQDLLDSSIWAKASPETRCVWITLLLMADADGYVGAALPGIAHRARVSEDQAREAIALLEAPDPDSRTPDREGRRIEKVHRGWLVFNIPAMRERAREAARKAYKAGWNARHRGKPANDNAEPDPRQLSFPYPQPEEPLPSTDVDTGGQNADTQKQRHKQSLSEERSPLPPMGDPVVIKELPEDWQPSDELRAKAKIAGVESLDHWVGKLRAVPIGGRGGVIASKLDAYIESQLPTWRTWEETERAKALAAKASPRGASGPPSRFIDGRALPSQLEPKPHHEAFAKKHGVDLWGIIRALIDEDAPTNLGLGRAREMIGERLTVAVKQKLNGHPVTGKLTRAELDAWGPVPTGGSIPAEVA